jgi:AcrR family transcriptional regulator
MISAQEQSHTETRTQILDAAEQRFRHYGYGKTTMAEIAKDVNMSAGNLYRFFQNKQDIAAACAQRCLATMVDELQPIVDDDSLTAAERLENYALGMLHYTHDQCENSSRINELVDMVANERPDLVHKNNQDLGLQVITLLESGHQSGEFEIEDPAVAADAILTALVKFRVPIFMGLYPLEQFEYMARVTTRLLVRGLRKC